MPKGKSQLAIILGAIWGVIWGSYLQFTRTGQWLASSRTWITVVVGVGMNLLISLLFLPVSLWLHLIGLFAISSFPIILRSLHNERRETETIFNALQNRKQRTHSSDDTP